MLTATEKSGLREILDDFSEVELYSLTATVSKGLLEVNSKEEAIQAIISCLRKPSDLLTRKKVTKKVLFSYLLKLTSFVSPESTKYDLVKMCLSKWCSVENLSNDSENSSTSADNENTSTSADNGNTSTSADNEGSSTSPDDQNSSEWWSIMGTQFAEWFFRIYNSLQDFGPQHFWNDCKLMGELKTAKDTKEATVVGAYEVVNFLISLIVNDKFYFDANVSQNSVISESDPHGLVRVLVSGVVHQMSNCIGLFDCFFGLVRNPTYQDNWKIKHIHMKIHVNRTASLAPGNPLPSICQ